MTEKELFDLLFTPGFSTAEQVTDISGRGIGLDIVKKTVEEMGGSVRIESTLGLGTTTTITLPLTTVIIDSLVVSVMGSVYAFPMSSVLEMIRPFRSELRKVQQGTVICLREEVVAILDLAEVLWNENRLPEIWSDDVQVTVVILDYNGKKVGLIVDNLLGKQEIVVKSLSKNYIDTEGLIGVTIMGTGKVALIMDIKGTLDAYYREREGKPVLTNRIVRDGRERGEEPYAAVTERTAEADLPAAESSSDDRLYRLNARESEKMEEVLIDGSINASESMTELLGHEVRVSFPDFRAIPLDGITESFGGDEAPVAGIFVEFGGDITGVWAIVMAMDDLHNISDYLMGQPQGSTKEISETEISALKEMGNILTASFIRSIVEATDLDVHLMVPEISIDMCLAVMDSILVRFNQLGREILVTEAELFSMETQNEICHLFILMENESTARLIQVLTREAKGLFEKAGLWRRRFLSEDDDTENGGDESEQPGELQRF